VDGPGYFYQPTILAGVTEGVRILSDEIFGPVAPIITFAHEDEAVRLANNTEYGLEAYVFGGFEQGSSLAQVVLAAGLNARDAGSWARARAGELESTGFQQIALAAKEKICCPTGFALVA
jgi:acyl-CoA reductase-like NAD-dependent aldehyde dehydrogenase